jgi:hypothetical protein
MRAVFSTSCKAVLTSVTPPAAMPSWAKAVDYRWSRILTAPGSPPPRDWAAAEKEPFCQCLLFFPGQLESYSENDCLCLYLKVFSLCFPVVISKFQTSHLDLWSILTWFCTGWETEM